MSGYRESWEEGTRNNRDRAAELSARQEQRRVQETLTRPEEPVTLEDERRALVQERQEAVVRAQRARKLVERVDDDSLWGKAPRLTGEWRMNEKTGQHVREHSETLDVPGPELEWAAFARHVEEDKTTGWTGPGKYALPRTGVPLRDGPELYEWAQEAEDDYGGGPVAWDVDIPEQDQGGQEASL